MPRGCPCCHASYPGTKLLPDGLRESSARAGGRTQPTKTLHLCSAGPAVPGPHRGLSTAIHQHVISEEKRTQGPVRWIEHPRRNKQSLLFCTSPAFHSAHSAQARREMSQSSHAGCASPRAQPWCSWLRRDQRLPRWRSSAPCRPRTRPRCLHAVLSEGARIPLPVPASPGAAGEMESLRCLPGIAESPMGINEENPNQREQAQGVPQSQRCSWPGVHICSHGHRRDCRVV